MTVDDMPERPETPAGEDGADQRVIPIYLVGSAEADDFLASLAPEAARWAALNEFTGKLGQALRVPNGKGGLDCVLIGWGDTQARSRDRFHIGDFARTAPRGAYRLATALDEDEADEAALGWFLGRYRFGKYKARGEETAADLIAPDSVDPARLVRIVEGVFMTRDLINIPASDLGPEALAGTCEKLATRHGAKLDVTIGDDLLAANLPMIHAVGRAGAQAPRLIDMRWGDGDHPALTLVGKGVCFDTGGLNIKPGSSMGLMKKDMGGAATVLGLAHMIMALGLPVRLRVLIPAVENAIDGSAMRPGDVLHSRLGKTVEINNTDAEGRLVLADALALAAEEEPDLIIDMATLTGAARVALGPDVVPFFTDDEDLAADLQIAAAASADPVWRLPLWPGYERDIEPEIADLDNAPKGGFAGSITAALFLKRFVGATRWAHFDVYGWVPKALPGRPMGGECQAARTILRVLEKRYRAGR